MSENENAKKPYVTYGDRCCGCPGSTLPVSGCRFTLAPMTDRYVEIIMDAVSKTDTSKVWKNTDHLSTVYRGKQVHVVDAVKACFIYSWREGVHMTMEATFTKGCPGDCDADCFMAEDDVRMNEEKIRDVHFPAACKIALYPMGTDSYMKEIAHVVNRAVDLGIYDRSTHYATYLYGDVQDLFGYFDEVTRYCGEHISHYILEVTLSVNSPTPRN